MTLSDATPEGATFPEEDVQEHKTVPEEELRDLMRRIEALLFVAPTAVSIRELSRALGVSAEQVEQAVQNLRIEREQSGVIVQRHRDRVQLVTAPDLAEDVERFLGLEPASRLSQAALETLAIIAYKQPITRAQIEAIRGVSSDGVLRSLLAKGLVEEVGRLETVGRPILYGTSPEFLQYFGLQSLEELPPLPEETIAADTLEQALVEWAEQHGKRNTAPGQETNQT